MTDDDTRWHETARPRYFGLPPRGIAAVAAGGALAAATVLFVAGEAVVGVLMLLTAVPLAVLYLEQARRNRESALDRTAAATVEHTKALAGFAGASARAWTGAGREVARLRLEARTRARERSQLQHELGAACFAGDDAQVEKLKEQMRLCTQRIEECAAEARAVVARARGKTARERRAIARTEIRG